MRRVGMVGIALLVMTGCGTRAVSADDVARQFIRAIQTNDQPAVQRMVAPEARMNVGSIPERIYAATTDPRHTLNYRPTGTFQGVDIETSTPRGAMLVSRSIWRYGAATECYDTTLARYDDGWKVISVYRSEQCP